MERLDFLLPDFTRVMWVTEKARAVWSPRFQRIGAAWAMIERVSVREGLRPAALQSVAPKALPELAAWAVRNGLVAVPLATTGASGTYQATPRQEEPGKPFEYRVAIARPEAAAAFADAFESGNDDVIGQLLGYPECCRAFFQEVWVEQKCVDTTWAMAERTSEARGHDHLLEVNGTPPEANILLRWIGVRAVPHLPHSFTCEETVDFGRRLMALGEASGFAEEVAWIRQMLRWPVEWSALHGIAEIKTPVLKVSARTDATGEKYVVRYHGDVYPEEGAQGLVFPFRPPKGRKLTETASYRKALEPDSDKEASLAPDTAASFAITQQAAGLSAVEGDGLSPWERGSLIQVPDQPPVIGTPAYYRDNGFVSLEAQERAHEVVLEAIVAACAGVTAPKVLDLGCGNGALLAKARTRIPDLQPHGVEINPKAAAHFRVLLPETPHSSPSVWVGDMFTYPFDEEYDVALIMPGRLLERTPEQAEAFMLRLSAHAKQLVVYAYGDWLKRYGGLERLWAATRMPGKLVRVCQKDENAAAGLVTWDEP